MKKALLIILAATATRLPAYTQTIGPVAEGFRSFYEMNESHWNKTVNYSTTINQAIMKKTIFMATLISATMSANAQTINKDEQAIRGIVATMQKGWNEKSGATFASGFAKVHDYIVINGLYLSAITPEINANAHQGIFNSVYKTTDLEMRVDKITFIRSDLALAYVIGATYQHGTAVPENPGAMISMVLEKKNEEWKIISFHNCDIEISFDPAAPALAQVPPKVMFGSWYKK